jgi:DNA-binding CsgD family transcriptional regulator
VLRGRAEILSLVDRWLAGLRSGDGGALQFVGTPGVGKTAILDAAAERGSIEGCRVLRAVGHTEETGIAWAGLSQLLAPHLSVIRRFDQRPRATLMRTMRLADHGAVDEVAIGMSLLYFLTYFDEPTVVVLDDLQWMDQPTVSVIQFVARRLHATGVGVLAASHPDTVLVAGSQISIDPLDLAELRSIARDRGAASAVADSLAREANGFPLMLDQMISQLRPDQLDGRSPLPEPISELGRGDSALDARLSLLPVPTRRFLAAAALAPYCAVSDLAAALGIDAPVDLLAPAAEVELVTADPERIAFRHPSMRTAALRAISPEDRHEIHSILAEITGVQHRGWHLAAAAIGPDANAAAALDDLAADAASRGAPLVALRARQTAIGIAPSADPQRALAAARDAVRARLPAVAGDLATQCTPGPECDALSAEVAWITGQVGPARQKWTEVIHNPATPPELQTDCRRRAAIAAFRMYDGPGVLKLAADYAITDPILDLVVAGSEVISGHAGAIDRLLAGATGLLADSPDPERVTALAEVVTLALARSGRAEDLGRLADQVNQLAVEIAAPVVPALLIAQAAHRSRSDLAGGVALIRQAVALAEEWDLAEHLPFALAIAAMCEASMDGPDAPEMIEGIRAYGIPVALAVADYAQALIHYGRGEYAPAREILAPLHERHPREKSFGFLWHADLVDIALRLGDRDLAERVGADLVEWVRMTESPWVAATSARATGLLASDRETASEFFRVAAESFEASGYLITAGRTRLDWAERLRRNRQRAAARTQVEIARAHLTAGGARRWVERCAREAEILGLNPAATSTSALEILSAREVQVARWLVAGLSFRQIGARLFISPRTAESHGQAIYRKLGVRGRAELAELARRDTALADHPN